MARAVLLPQRKLLRGAWRDLLLSPLSAGAAWLDVAISKRPPPRFFRGVLQLGERSDEWIDLCSGARDEAEAQRESVDALMVRVEKRLRDSQSGERRTRLRKRWAHSQVLCARLPITAEPSGNRPSDGRPAAQSRCRDCYGSRRMRLGGQLDHVQVGWRYAPTGAFIANARRCSILQRK